MIRSRRRCRPIALLPSIRTATCYSLNSTGPFSTYMEHVRNKSCVSACPATFPFSLPLAYLIGRPAVCCGVELPVCPYVGVVLQSPRARHAQLVTDHPRKYPRSILVRHVRHARFPRDLLATSSVRENVCNNSKKRKKVMFSDFEKKT